jgi:hypothetical protein
MRGTAWGSPAQRMRPKKKAPACNTGAKWVMFLDATEPQEFRPGSASIARQLGETNCLFGHLSTTRVLPFRIFLYQRVGDHVADAVVVDIAGADRRVRAIDRAILADGEHMLCAALLTGGRHSEAKPRTLYCVAGLSFCPAAASVTETPQHHPKPLAMP